MREPLGLRSRMHRSAHRLMCHGLGLSLLQGSNVLLLLSIAGQFRPFHDQWELPLADVKKTVAPAKSSPPKKGEKNNKPSSPKQQVEPVHASDAYFTVKTHKGKSKESSPVISVHISPIKFKERLKRSYHNKF